MLRGKSDFLRTTDYGNEHRPPSRPHHASSTGVEVGHDKAAEDIRRDIFFSRNRRQSAETRCTGLDWERRLPAETKHRIRKVAASICR